ncbi:single-stranded DNA-binding protein [Natroniella sp. ANB-PHB2]|uniref:single-stranded DNA-binding protein n=1 Tax=Natroniella sp. ANB-PHB2 TaxID=3384444 RepID=UPI0038D3DDB0
MMNKVVLIGRWTSDGELRYTSNGNGVYNNSLAVERPYSKDDEVDFIEVVAWRKLAENLANHSGKGRLVAVEGSMKQERWENDQGQNRSKIVVNANNVKFLDWPDKDQKQSDNEGIDVPF